MNKQQNKLKNNKKSQYPNNKLLYLNQIYKIRRLPKIL